MSFCSFSFCIHSLIIFISFSSSFSGPVLISPLPLFLLVLSLSLSPLHTILPSYAHLPSLPIVYLNCLLSITLHCLHYNFPLFLPIIYPLPNISSHSFTLSVLSSASFLSSSCHLWVEISSFFWGFLLYDLRLHFLHFPGADRLFNFLPYFFPFPFFLLFAFSLSPLNPIISLKSHLLSFDFLLSPLWTPFHSPAPVSPAPSFIRA